MGGGNTTVQAPQPTAGETALTNQQLKLLKLQGKSLAESLRMADLLSPILYEQLGIKPVYKNVEVTKQVLNPEYQRVEAALATAQANSNFDGDNRYGSNFEEIKRLTNELGTLDKFIDGETVTKRKLTKFKDLPDTPEEKLQKKYNKEFLEMSLQELQLSQELAPQRADIERQLLERSQKALKGELPIDPALTRSLETEEAALRDRLFQQLGPGYETSTPGIEALANFSKRKGELIHAASRDELTLGEQLSQTREGMGLNKATAVLPAAELAERFKQQKFGNVIGLPSANQPNFASLVGAINGPLSSLAQNRSMDLQAQMANAQSKSASSAGYGQLFGTVATAAAIYF